MDKKRLAMNASLGVSLLMLIGKLSAYLITGSTAILSDAAESVIHIFITGVASISLWYAERPADAKHPYGHGKIMAFSVGLEGLLILVAALYIVIEAVMALVAGPKLSRLDYGLFITGSLAAVNLILGLYLIRTGKREHSPILVANGHHVLTDMWTSIAVLGGVFLVWVTDYVILDPLFALLAAAGILYTGSSLVREAFGAAMDQASPEDTSTILKILDDLVQSRVISGYHQLRHREINSVHWIELHILVPGTLTVTQAHKLVTEAERKLDAAFPGKQVYITSHIEPEDHRTAHPEGHSLDPLSTPSV